MISKIQTNFLTGPEEMKVKSYTIDLSEQMAVCDANYIRLLKLLGNTRSLNERIIGLPQLGSHGGHGEYGKYGEHNQHTEKGKHAGYAGYAGYAGKGKQEQVLVHLEVLENFKYTSTISIRQILSSQIRSRATENAEQPTRDITKHAVLERESSAYYNSPEMIIRVYHDAKTAEVTSYQNHRYFKAIYPVPNRFMYQCDEKEQLNLFLAEWLNLCINEGLSNPNELQLESLIYH